MNIIFTIQGIDSLKKKTDGSTYLAVKSNADGSVYCWTPELMNGLQIGDTCEAVVNRRERNGKVAYDIKEIKKVEPVPEEKPVEQPKPAEQAAETKKAEPAKTATSKTAAAKPADEAPIPEDEDEDAPIAPDDMEYSEDDADEAPMPDEADEAPIPEEAPAKGASKTAKPTTPKASAKTAAPAASVSAPTITSFTVDDEEVTGENMEVYNSVRKVPAAAKKPINAGRLKGMTDINPVWRIKKLTEMFGPVGFGWKYVITKKELVEVTNNAGKKEIKAFVDIDLFYKYKGAWSEAIPGTGGSSFVSQESAGMYVSDECYKMALTDAISVACKALGVGADVYWEADASDKYNR